MRRKVVKYFSRMHLANSSVRKRALVAIALDEYQICI